MTEGCRDLNLCCQDLQICTDQDNLKFKKIKPRRHFMLTSKNGFPEKTGNHEKLYLDYVDILRLIKVCGKENDLRRGTRIHSDIVARGMYLKDVRITTVLITMYARCGCLAEAQQLFDAIAVPDVVSWTALITGYVHNDFAIEALKCYKVMLEQGCSPNAITFAHVLKACNVIGCVDHIEKVHADIIMHGLLEENNVLGNALVDIYAKCGMLGKAQKVFDELPVRDVVSWTTLITGYTRAGLSENALDCFSRMLQEGISADAISFTCALKACSATKMVEKGEEFYYKIRKCGLLEHDGVLGTALVDMYVKCGLLAKAQKVFDELPVLNTGSWNALMCGYVQHGFGDQALSLFEQMQIKGFLPDSVTFLCALKACAMLGFAEKGEQIHAEIKKYGLLQERVELGTALVDMYIKCGLFEKALDLFHKLQKRDIVSWNAIIAAYNQLGACQEALKCLRLLQEDGLSPNSVTFTCILNACGSMHSYEEGAKVHAEIKELELLHKDAELGTALVDMYAKCGAFFEAREAFEQLPVHDVMSWNALIAGYVQYGLVDQALNCYDTMQHEGISPDAVTFSHMLKACGAMASPEKGEEIHGVVCKLGFLDKDVVLGTLLVDMYVKCGVVLKAQDVFDKHRLQDIVSWNALVAGYSQVGLYKSVSALFDNMIAEDNVPDAVTFVILLTACSHAGLVEEGQMYFDIMNDVYCLQPTLEHCTCMVDLFSRAGEFDKAIAVFEKAQLSDHLPLCLTLLGALRKWMNIGLGRWVFEYLSQLDENCPAAYVCISDIYAGSGF